MPPRTCLMLFYTLPCTLRPKVTVRNQSEGTHSGASCSSCINVLAGVSPEEGTARLPVLCACATSHPPLLEGRPQPLGCMHLRLLRK